MDKRLTATIVALGLMILASMTEAKTIRATEMNSTMWAELHQGRYTDVIVEFRKGDELPISLAAQGDLIESSQPATTFVSVKRNFWIKGQENKLLISIDGVTFKNFSDILTGSIIADARTEEPGGGVASAMNLLLKANLR